MMIELSKTIDYYIEEIEKEMARVKDENGKHIYPNRSHFGHVLKRLAVDPELQYKAAKRAVELVIYSMVNQTPVTNLCIKLGHSVGYISGYTPNDPPKVADKGICKMGMTILGFFQLRGWVKVKKFTMDDPKHQQWHVVPTGEFVDMIVKQNTFDGVPCITDGAIEWVEPIIMHNGHPTQLVKRSISAKLYKHYTKKEIPLVYAAVNRANAQTWRVNNHVLNLVHSAGEDNPFLPETVTYDEVDKAKEAIMKLGWRAENYKKFLMREVLNNSTLPEDELLRIAKSNTATKFTSDEVVLRKVLSSWDKLITHNKIVDIATKVRNQDLNFLYSLDSRGRMYAESSYLHPLERDIAKALLNYSTAYPVCLYDLAIVTANLLGQDKLTHEKRVEYVNANMDLIRTLGNDPWSHIDELVALKLGKKEKWQALAIFNVWHRYHEHLDAGGVAESFTSSVPCAYDASCQGLQILSAIGRDSFCGPMVNIAPTADGSPGDAYAYVASFLSGAIDALPEEKQSPTMTAFNDVIKDKVGLARPVVKRNVMTKNYSGTSYGMGKQHLSDKDDYGFQEAYDLTGKDCFALGRTIYQLTEEHFKKPSELMTWMQEGINHLPTNEATIMWRMPDGLLCFAYKSTVRRQSVHGRIGTQKVALTISVPTGDKNTAKHKAAVSPNIVHSIDGYILREILRNLSPDAPISTVHDSFASSSHYLGEIVDIAKEAYVKVGDRVWFEDMMGQAFKHYRPLPEAGDLDINEIYNTDYVLS